MMHAVREAVADAGAAIKAGYEDVAEEYYDERRHPTCAGFRALSRSYLAPRLLDLAKTARDVLEVGAGRSIVAEILAGTPSRRVDLSLLDSSAGMLSHSAGLKGPSRFIVADAAATGLADESVDVLVSSLGDPYNSARFWREVSRLLRPGGVCLFTTPSWRWAKAFRDGGDGDRAEFLTSDGRILAMPSSIPSEREQRGLWKAAHLSLLEIEEVTTRELSYRAPPKLAAVAQDVPVLTAATLRR